MMAEKKYYWLKLQKDFFKRHDIRIIESMTNGKDYILFYLKLLVESVSHEGLLRFSDTIPYNEEMLSTITDTNVDIVRSAMKAFQELHMIEILEDETIFMSEVEKMIGSETDAHIREQNRIRQQRYRDNKKLEMLENTQKNETSETEEALHNVTVTLHRNAEIELDKEKEIEKELDKEKRVNISYQQIADTYNSICVSFPRLTTLSDNRKKAIKARINSGYSVDDITRVFEKAEESDFLKGKNDRNWSATFDWMLKDANMAKILDGNYDNKTNGTTSTSGSAYMDAIKNRVNVVDSWV